MGGLLSDAHYSQWGADLLAFLYSVGTDFVAFVYIPVGSRLGGVSFISVGSRLRGASLPTE